MPYGHLHRPLGGPTGGPSQAKQEALGGEGLLRGWRLEPLHRSSWRRGVGKAVDAIIAIHLAAILREYRADRKERAAQDCAKTWREWLTIIGLVVAALIAGLNLRHIQRDALATHRAWLSIDEVKIRPESGFTKDGGKLGIEFRVTNKGETPATNIEATITDCDQIKCHALTGHPFAGNPFADYLHGDNTVTRLALFQGDHFVVNRTLTYKPEQIFWTTQPDGRTTVNFDLFVGTGYSIIGESKRHVTAIPFGPLQFKFDGDELSFTRSYELAPNQLFEPVVD